MLMHAAAVVEGAAARTILSPVKDVTLLFQWCCIWLGFLLVLYLVQVPKLTFRFEKLLVYAVVTVFLQALLLHPTSPLSARSVVRFCLLSRLFMLFAHVGLNRRCAYIPSIEVGIFVKSRQRLYHPLGMLEEPQMVSDVVSREKNGALEGAYSRA
jgi:hypothetical protein